MNSVTLCHCPTLAAFVCDDWPNSNDLTYPRLIFFKLSVLAPDDAHRAFEEALQSVIVVANSIFVADAAFWNSLNTASARCLEIGIYVEKIQEL